MKEKAFDPETEVRIAYGFGHLASSETHPDDAHAGDSRDLAWETFDELGLSPREQAVLRVAAEWVGEWNVFAHAGRGGTGSLA